jgi:phenylpropionate dioxygenase-like ring-hydroxylating dioxygenase large terminal subunit
MAANPQAIRSEAQPSEQDVDTLLRVGLRNRWYPIIPSSHVTGQLLPLYRMGEKLVAWRDDKGVVHVQEDHCPHRGAPLSLGRHLGNRVACKYHGVEVDADGRVVSVPGSPGCTLEGQLAVKTYPAQELAGAVFAWFGDALHPEPAPFVPPPQLAGEDYDRFLCYTEWHVPYSYMIDNNLDPMHGTFLHKQSHSMAVGDIKAKFQVKKTPTGFLFEKVTQRDVNFDWSEWCDTGALYARLEIPYPKTGGPGGNFGIIFMIVPIHDRLCASFFFRNRKVSGWQRDAWKFLYRNRLEARHWHVLEQDRAVMEAIEPDANQREYLYDHDVGVARVRRWMREEAVSQLKALAAAGKPKPWERQSSRTAGLDN